MYMYGGGQCMCHQCPHMIKATPTLNHKFQKLVYKNEEEGESLGARLIQIQATVMCKVQ